MPYTDDWRACVGLFMKATHEPRGDYPLPPEDAFPLPTVVEALAVAKFLFEQERAAKEPSKPK